MFRHCLPFALLLVAVAPAQSPRILTNRPSGTELLRLPKEEDAFGFVIFGDRTGGPPEGIEVLKQAVADTNLLDPDLVLTVGDLVNGYNATDAWLAQAAEYKDAMAKLRMPWFPVAGNHDVYWRGQGKPPEEHEGHYEATFGPLWYAVAHKQCWFVVLYSDEANPETGERNFNKPECQRVSPAQFAWLGETLQKAKGARHVFVFLHHPRWLAQYGDDWQRVHELLASNGNVTAVFAGHIHHMRYDGTRDGIQYYTVASVGAHLAMDAPDAGFLHQFHVVTVRPEGITVAALPVGTVVDPQALTGEIVEDFERVHRELRVEALSLEPAGQGPAITLDGPAAGAVDGIATLRCHNPGKRAIELEIVPQADTGWTFSPDHQHLVVGPGKAGETTFAIRRTGGGEVPFTLPRAEVRCDYLAPDRRLSLPNRTLPIDLPPPAELEQLAGGPNGVLVLDGRHACLEVASDRIALPDGPMTIEAWVCGEEFEGRRGMIAKTEGSEYALFCNDGTIDFSVHLDGHYVTAKSSGPVLRTGVWHHVAGVYDGREVRVYVDGVKQANRVGSGHRTLNRLPLFVGADPNGKGVPVSHFHGMLDDVRLSKVARYHDDVFRPPQRHAPDADTVLLFACDRDFGPWVPDLSPQHAPATQRGSAHCTLAERGPAPPRER